MLWFLVGKLVTVSAVVEGLLIDGGGLLERFWTGGNVTQSSIYRCWEVFDYDRWVVGTAVDVLGVIVRLHVGVVLVGH